MPKTEVVIYRNKDGSVPLFDWLDALPAQAKDKCVIKVEMLAEFGFDLRRPHCDILEKGIYELRAKFGHVQYRILYFFKGRNVAILSHGCTKEKEVSRNEIDKAAKHRSNYIRNPGAHTYKGALK